MSCPSSGEVSRMAPRSAPADWHKTSSARLSILSKSNPLESSVVINSIGSAVARGGSRAGAGFPGRICPGSCCAFEEWRERAASIRGAHSVAKLTIRSASNSPKPSPGLLAASRMPRRCSPLWRGAISRLWMPASTSGAASPARSSSESPSTAEASQYQPGTLEQRITLDGGGQPIGLGGPHRRQWAIGRHFPDAKSCRQAFG